MSNFSDLLDRLLASLHSTSAATQQIAQRELKSALVQHKQELESQIMGLRLEVGNMRELLVSCLRTGETLACSIQKGEPLSRGCLIEEQKHLEQLRLLTLTVNGMEGEVKCYYDNMQSLLLYLRQNVDDGPNTCDKMSSINGVVVSMETPTAKPTRVEPTASPDNQSTNGNEKKIPIKHVHFASERSNSTYGKVWVNPVYASSNGSGKSNGDVVFAEDLPGPAKIRLDDDDVISSHGDTSSVTTSALETQWPTGRTHMPLTTLDTYDFGDTNGSWSQQAGRVTPGKARVSPVWAGDMRDCVRVGTPRLAGVIGGATRTSYPPIGMTSKSPRTPDRKFSSVSFRVKPDSARRVDTPDHCGTMGTVLPRFRAPLHRANSERTPSVFDKSRRRHSMSPRAGPEQLHDDRASRASVTVIQLGDAIKSPRQPATPVVANHTQTPKEKLVRKPSASLHKVVLTLNEGHAVPMSPRGPREIVAPPRVWSSRQGRLS